MVSISKGFVHFTLFNSTKSPTHVRNPENAPGPNASDEHWFAGHKKIKMVTI
jgi:hypothetical protein